MDIRTYRHTDIRMDEIFCLKISGRSWTPCLTQLVNDFISEPPKNRRSWTTLRMRSWMTKKRLFMNAWHGDFEQRPVPQLWHTKRSGTKKMETKWELYWESTYSESLNLSALVVYEYMVYWCSWMLFKGHSWTYIMPLFMNAVLGLFMNIHFLPLG